jgi:hypothetical protein
MASQPEEDNAEDEAPRKCTISTVVADPATGGLVEAVARLVVWKYGHRRSRAAMKLTGGPIRPQVAG